ncbi:MAG: bifunctional 4-hydroxy-2-oxoglutarate aldolase/2-dehydro-3-deoxy-phosphogluconate aldolase, partial [Oscillospiraceae bacterium]
MKQIVDKLYSIGLVPVVKIDDPETAVPIAKALQAGGIPCIEVTFRTEHAAEAIKSISTSCPDVLIGAGTVLRPDQADLAIKSGAHFVVSPGFNPSLVQHCKDNKITIIPGCSTASDMEKAIDFGFDT